MEVKSRALLLAIMVAAVIPCTTSTAATVPTTTAWTTGYTTGGPGLDLDGKMFTLSRYGGVSLRPPTSDTATYPPWTTSAPSSGATACLRFVSEAVSGKIFTLGRYSPSSITLSSNGLQNFQLSWDYSGLLQSLKPGLRFWPSLTTGFWTSLCLTVDSRKSVVQLFSGGNMSIRKRLPQQYTRMGQAVMDISGFDGQVTDVQVWDHALSYREIYTYMSNVYYGFPRGNILTWSYIAFSLMGDTLLEDTFQRQAGQPMRQRGWGQRKLHKQEGKSAKKPKRSMRLYLGRLR